MNFVGYRTFRLHPQQISRGVSSSAAAAQTTCFCGSGLPASYNIWVSENFQI